MQGCFCNALYSWVSPDGLTYNELQICLNKANQFLDRVKKNSCVSLTIHFFFYFYNYRTSSREYRNLIISKTLLIASSVMQIVSFTTENQIPSIQSLSIVVAQVSNK